jgi:hypothetical protein
LKKRKNKQYSKEYTSIISVGKRQEAELNALIFPIKYKYMVKMQPSMRVR